MKFALPLLALLLWGAPVFGDTPAFEIPEPGTYSLPTIMAVEEHQLLDGTGEPAPLLRTGEGDVALVSFVYLSCNESCPLSTATLHRLDRELARDPSLRERVELVTVSFDPARDTPERMQALEKHLAPKGPWRFLTARDSASLVPVLRDFGQDAVWVPRSEGSAPDRLRHVLKVFLVDDSGAVRNIYSTGLMEPGLVLADVRTVLGLH